MIGLAGWLVASVWIFSGVGSTDYLLAVVSGFIFIAVALPFSRANGSAATIPRRPRFARVHPGISTHGRDGCADPTRPPNSAADSRCGFRHDGLRDCASPGRINQHLNSQKQRWLSRRPKASTGLSGYSRRAQKGDDWTQDREVGHQCQYHCKGRQPSKQPQ